MEEGKKKHRSSSQIKKSRFLKAFKESLGVISYACDKANVSRQTYYDWIKKDEEFARNAENVEEESVDLAESKLKIAINEGNITAILFYLKTKGKKRGYVEQVDNRLVENPFEKLMKELPDEEDNDV